MTPPEVADRICRLGTRWGNFYLLVDGREATLIDAGYPRYWPQVPEALEGLGLRADSIAAVLVTHHHVDHAGTAEQVSRSTTGLLPPVVASEHGALFGPHSRRRRRELSPGAAGAGP
jgi:glyoxylase-like metal-dependent hydrolase (beta-lactamase superfamily II)